MYYLAKIFQATGLTVILIGFLVNFPSLMSHASLLLGLCLFVLGWLIQQFMARRARP